MHRSMKSGAINKQSTTGTAFTYTNLQEQDLQHWIPYLKHPIADMWAVAEIVLPIKQNPTTNLYHLMNMLNKYIILQR